MEPTNHPFRKEHDLPNLHYCVPCQSSGVDRVRGKTPKSPMGETSQPVPNSVGRKRWMVKSGEWLFLLSQAVSVFLGKCFFCWYLFCVVDITPRKTDMEPKNGALEDDFPLQAGDFQVPC